MEGALTTGRTEETMKKLLPLLALLLGLPAPTWANPPGSIPPLTRGYRVEFSLPEQTKRFDSDTYPGTWLAEANRFRLALHRRGFLTWNTDDGTANGDAGDGGL